jgi:hypothetical protein
MYYLLTYQAVDNYVEKRAPLREAHLTLVRAAHERGELLLAGALADPVDGSVFLFKCEDQAVVAHFAKNDPYVLGGIIISWTVRKWTVVVGA